MTRVALLTVLLVAACSRPAVAWDPYGDELDAGATERPSDPTPFVIPDGVYLVTDVYAGDVVTRSGDTTTYSTTTVRETPGTFARVVDVVGTASGSAYDGTSFNGRAVTTDGRSVAGTYYEDFVLTPNGFVSVNIVFFQDDSETARRLSTVPPTPSPSAGTPLAIATATPTPRTTVAPFVVVTMPPQATAAAAPTPRPLATHIAIAGIALGPAAPLLARIEVLRGRTVTLYPRAFVDGVAVPVRTWRLVSGTVSAGACAGSGVTPSCDAAWLTLAPAGTSFRLLFELVTDSLPGQVLSATIDVIVRSPALEQ